MRSQPDHGAPSPSQRTLRWAGVTAAVLVAASGVAGCTSHDDPPPLVEDVPIPSSTAGEPGVVPSAELGHPYGIGCTSRAQPCDVTVTLTALRLTDSCTGGVAAPPGAKYLAVSVDVAVAATPSAGFDPQVLRAQNWASVSRDGRAFPGYQRSTACPAHLNGFDQPLVAGQHHLSDLTMIVPDDTVALTLATPDGHRWQWMPKA